MFLIFLNIGLSFYSCVYYVAYMLSLPLSFSLAFSPLQCIQASFALMSLDVLLGGPVVEVLPTLVSPCSG